MSKRKWIIWTAAAACAVGMVPVLAQTGTTTAPSFKLAPGAGEEKAPTTQISPEAKAELDKVRAAYAKVDSLSLTGTLHMDFDVAGKPEKQDVDFSSIYSSPNMFRHEVKGRLLVGSTGTKDYAYSEQAKQYVQADAPAGKVAVEQMPPFVSQLLSRQDPSLLLALAKDASAELIAGAVKVDKLPDQKVGDQSYTALNVQTPNGDEHVLVDQKTHLVKQVKVDLTKALEARGAPQVKKAELVSDYTQTQTGVTFKPEQFQWTPPADATDAAKAQAEAQSKEPAMGLQGKEAPDFTLEDLQGNKQTLSKMKGSVVVLDFWATWCPPCRESLPHLDALYKEFSPKGLKVYAVNVQEPKQTAAEYLKKNNLTFPVLLDSNGEVGMKYQAQAIPETIVVGKDGKIAKVFVGFSPDMEKSLKEVVQEAMK